MLGRFTRMRFIPHFVAFVCVVLLTGCTSTRPTSSTPPATAISFAESFSVGDSASDMVFPAGRYLPVREDKHGFYFHAPEKVSVRDQLFGSRYSYDGGVYWKRDESVPSQLYVNALYGRPMKFPAPLQSYALAR